MGKSRELWTQADLKLHRCAAICQLCGPGQVINLSWL